METWAIHEPGHIHPVERNRRQMCGRFGFRLLGPRRSLGSGTLGPTSPRHLVDGVGHRLLLLLLLEDRPKSLSLFALPGGGFLAGTRFANY